MADVIINTANTLSPFVSPGQDKRFPITSSDSVFTFGDFKIQRPNIFDNLNSSSSAITFSSYATLDNFSGDTSSEVSPDGTSGNELNPDVRDPNAYSYFGSFYTRVSRSINELIDTFPYAILSYAYASANTVFDYSKDTIAGTSTFKIPISAATNQGNVIFASGVTNDGTTKTLYNNFNLYGIQFSGTANTHTYNIVNYKYTTGTSGYFHITVKGFLFSGTTTASTQPIYIRPTTNDYSHYQRNISNLNYQLAFDGTFKVPDVDNDSVFVYETVEWPRLIDGFNIDTYGDDYEEYKTTILNLARRVDEVKTSWMVRTMLPEQFIELDTESQIYQKLTSTFAEEFDTIKAYIDNLAYMHSANYSRKEGIPDKFMYKLSKLLGFDFHDAFADTDVFEYFLEEDETGNTLQDYNLELWRKMLTNIVWLYKKKGTRDAIMFLFKVMGAPDCLVNLNEFVYRVNKTKNHNSSTGNTIGLAEQNFVQSKIDEDGYINYDSSKFIFQEGGSGRGNGQNYIDQWEPQFKLLKEVDNVKIHTGDTEFGTRDIVNTKEAQISLDPAAAIECDVKEWYELGFGVWNWGTTGLTASPFTILGFSGMTVPFEWTPDPYSIFNIMPPNISAMTITQWMDFIYASNVDPRSRKVVNAYSNNSIGQYISLKKIYMTYMLWTNNQESNRLTFGHLERLLELLERNFFKYMADFVPATTIIDTTAVVYRNTLFERQKFVYQKGINDGSEFQKKLPDEIIKVLNVTSIAANPNNNIESQPDAFSVVGNVANNVVADNSLENIVAIAPPLINPVNFGFTVVSNFYPESEQNFTKQNVVTPTISNYTSGNTVILFDGNEAILLGEDIPISILSSGSIGVDNVS